MSNIWSRSKQKLDPCFTMIINSDGEVSKVKRVPDDHKHAYRYVVALVPDKAGVRIYTRAKDEEAAKDLARKRYADYLAGLKGTR